MISFPLFDHSSSCSSTAIPPLPPLSVLVKPFSIKDNLESTYRCQPYILIHPWPPWSSADVIVSGQWLLVLITKMTESSTFDLQQKPAAVLMDLRDGPAVMQRYIFSTRRSTLPIVVHGYSSGLPDTLPHLVLQQIYSLCIAQCASTKMCSISKIYPKLTACQDLKLILLGSDIVF